VRLWPTGGERLDQAGQLVNVRVLEEMAGLLLIDPQPRAEPLDILVASCVAYVCGGLCEGPGHGGASRGKLKRGALWRRHG